MKCRKCRNIVPPSFKFCAYCGGSLSTPPKHQVYTATSGASSGRKADLRLSGVGALLVIILATVLFSIFSKQEGDNPIALIFTIMALLAISTNTWTELKGEEFNFGCGLLAWPTLLAYFVSHRIHFVLRRHS